MALDLRLQSPTYSLDLTDTTVYGIPDGGIGVPDVSTLFAPIWGGWGDPSVGVDYANRPVAFTLNVRGTSLDNFIVAAQQLDRLLLESRIFHAEKGRRGEPAVLSVKMNGMSYGVELDVMDFRLAHGESIFQNVMTKTSAPTLPSVPVTLVCKPFTRPQALTRVTSGTLNNGGGASATNDYFGMTAAGDVACPIRLTYQSAAGDTFQRIMVGKKTDSPNFLFALNMETGTHTGHTTTDIGSDAGVTETNEVVATAHAGAVHRLAFTASTSVDEDWMQVEITKNLQDFAGRHAVYLRVDAFTSFTDGFAQLKFGGGSGTDITRTEVAIPGSNDRIIFLGYMDIPHRITKGNLVSFKFVIALDVANAAGATRNLDLDCVYLLPLSEGVMDLTLSAAASAQDMIVSDLIAVEPTVYIVDSAGDWQPETFTGPHTFFSTVPGRETRFYFLMVTLSGSEMDHNLTDQATLQADYWPLYMLFRAA